MNHLRQRLGAAAVAGLLGAVFAELVACGTCTDIGCVQNVVVTPEHSLSDAGNYEVDLVADSASITCTIVVPSTAPARCTDSRAFVSQERGRGVVWLSVDGKIKDLSVTVVRDGTTVADQSFAVAYQNVELNGEGCGTCPAASETLKLQ